MLTDSAAEPLHALIAAGDLAYGGTGRVMEFEFVWDLWQRIMSPLARQMPLVTAVGNHEQYFNFTAYRTRLRMPGAESGGEGNFWFSLDYGMAHIVSFSTEHPYGPGSEQCVGRRPRHAKHQPDCVHPPRGWRFCLCARSTAPSPPHGESRPFHPHGHSRRSALPAPAQSRRYAWLEADLKKAHANRSARPWIVVTCHRPMCVPENSALCHSGLQASPRPAPVDALWSPYGGEPAASQWLDS